MLYEDARDTKIFQFVKSFKIPHISMATIWLGKDERRECISHCQIARRNEVLQFAKLGMGKMFWRLEFYQNPNPRCTIISHCELAWGKSNFQSEKFCVGINLKHVLLQHQLVQQINSVKTFSLGRSIACLKLQGGKGILYCKQLSQWILHYSLEWCRNSINLNLQMKDSTLRTST